MAEKLHQNRIVVLGKDHNDARLQADRSSAVQGYDDVTTVSADSLSQAILGGVGGMHVAKVFVTPSAYLGTNFRVAKEALQTCIERGGGEFVELEGAYGDR